MRTFTQYMIKNNESCNCSKTIRNNMKKLLLISTILLLSVSCGTKESTLILVEKPYDDSKLVAYDLLNDARIDAMEVRLAQLETLNQLNTEASELLKDQVEQNYLDLNNLLDELQLEVHNNKVTVHKICTSNEHLLKLQGDFYAVYMVSNNFGTYLGKLDSNVNYSTTDNVHASFKIVSGNIVCN